jgi:hypothetical protein
MQKFLEFVFAVLFWLGDCCLLFIESCKDGIFGIIQEVFLIITLLYKKHQNLRALHVKNLPHFLVKSFISLIRKSWSLLLLE